jgi:hypothetical protein
VKGVNERKGMREEVREGDAWKREGERVRRGRGLE